MPWTTDSQQAFPYLSIRFTFFLFIFLSCFLFFFLPPQLFKPRRIGRRVNDGVLNVPVPQIVLDQAGVGPLVGQGKPAGMAEHVRVRRHGQSGFLAIGADRNPCRLAA